MSAELLDRIRDVQFTPVRLREGYDMGEVDTLLDRLVAAIGRGETVDHLVDGARFTPVRLREGYDMGEVDQFLEDVRAAAAGGIPAVQDPGVVRDPGVIQEQRGLLARLFGRK